MSVKAQTPHTLSVHNTTSCSVHFIAGAYSSGACSGTHYSTNTYVVNSGATVTLVWNMGTSWNTYPGPSGPVDWSDIKIMSGCGSGGTVGSCDVDYGGYNGCLTQNICMYISCGACSGNTVNTIVDSWNVSGTSGELYVTLH